MSWRIGWWRYRTEGREAPARTRYRAAAASVLWLALVTGPCCEVWAAWLGQDHSRVPAAGLHEYTGRPATGDHRERPPDHCADQAVAAATLPAPMLLPAPEGGGAGAVAYLQPSPLRRAAPVAPPAPPPRAGTARHLLLLRFLE